MYNYLESDNFGSKMVRSVRFVTATRVNKSCCKPNLEAELYFKI